MYIGIHRGGAVVVGKGKDSSYLRVSSLPDNYCQFTSHARSDFYVNFFPHGGGGTAKTRNVNDASSQFFIRMVVRNHSPLSLVLTHTGPLDHIIWPLQGVLRLKSIAKQLLGPNQVVFIIII